MKRILTRGLMGLVLTIGYTTSHIAFAQTPAYAPQPKVTPVTVLPAPPVVLASSITAAPAPIAPAQPLPDPVPAPTPAPDPTPAPAPAPVLQNDAPSDCGDNSYSQYIYSHESSCSTTVINAEGCLGIGQACPASKLLLICPNEDYACENQFFTDYANTVYGGWQGAYNFWVVNHWW